MTKKSKWGRAGGRTCAPAKKIEKNGRRKHASTGVKKCKKGTGRRKTCTGGVHVGGVSGAGAVLLVFFLKNCAGAAKYARMPDHKDHERVRRGVSWPLFHARGPSKSLKNRPVVRVFVDVVRACGDTCIVPPAVSPGYGLSWHTSIKCAGNG